MERSPIQLLRERGKSLRAIAAELGHTTPLVSTILMPGGRIINTCPRR
jgi:hypothetical protein